MSEKQQKVNKFTNEDLKTMQSWDLDRKISVSLARIAEFYNKFPHRIYVLMQCYPKESTHKFFVDIFGRYFSNPFC